MSEKSLADLRRIQEVRFELLFVADEIGALRLQDLGKEHAATLRALARRLNATADTLDAMDGRGP